MNEVVTISGPSPRIKRGATRLVIATALALVLATLGVAGASAAPTSNPNAGVVPLLCPDGDHIVTIWVNFTASDRSDGGAPAHVVSGDSGQVFKGISLTGPFGTYDLHFDGAPKLERVDCIDPWGNTLTGVFIP